MNRLLCATLALGVGLSSPAFAFDLENMSDEERAAFQAEIRSYLLENPQVIMEAVAVLEEREAEAQKAEDIALVRNNKAELFESETDWVGGNPDGNITMVEFVDYRCGYCRKAHDEVAKLLEEDGNIRLVVKDFPILGPDSLTSARFAIAVKLLGGNDAYHQASEALIRLKASPEEPVLRRLAETLSLDADLVLAKMDSDEVSDVIAANHALGQRMRVNGTPTFVIGEHMLRGYMPLGGMMQIVGEQRDKAE